MDEGVTFQNSATAIQLKSNLAALLSLRDLKASDLSRRSDVSESVLCEWKAGRILRGVENLVRIARTLGVTAEIYVRAARKKDGMPYSPHSWSNFTTTLNQYLTYLR